VTTVTEEVPAVAISPAGMTAIIWVDEEKVVTRAIPFQ
jgi:hypothetical protein